MSERLSIGVSACLVGERVRFDGSHCGDDFVRSLDVELVPVCPEVEMGLGTPRETLRLVRRADGNVSLVAPRSERDLTIEMERFARARVAALPVLDGFIVKKGSPSCGLERVKLYGDTIGRSGQGRFTAALLAARPLLPVEDEGRLRDEGLRERFFVRARVYHRLQRLAFTPAELVRFHTSLKFELLACSPGAYRELGRLVAKAKELDRATLAATYSTKLMRALAIVPSRGRHTNVLQHLAGWFADEPADERRELAELIDEYAAGRAPRESPLTLVRHHARRRKHPWLAAQLYLQRSLP